MKVERKDGQVHLVLDDPAEVQLLRWALERASFTDTPVTRQEEILNFCGKALEALG